MCDRVIIINKGKIVANEKPDNLQNLLSKEVLIEVEFEKAILQNDLQQISNVYSIEQLTSTHFVLHGKDSTQLRKDIFAYAVSKNNPLLTLKQESKSLEDIFHQLTQQK